MFLHIGNGVSIKTEEIIGIFDLDTSTVSKITKNYINKNEKKGLIEYTDYDLPRSFVLFGNKKQSKIKLSRISSVGLKLRVDGENKLFGE